MSREAKYSVEDVQTIRLAITAGVSQQEVSKVFGIAPAYIRVLLRRAGIPETEAEARAAETRRAFAEVTEAARQQLQEHVQRRDQQQQENKAKAAEFAANQLRLVKQMTGQ